MRDFTEKDKRFKITDIIFIIGMIMPIAFAVVLKVLTSAPSEGIDLTGAMVYFTIDMPIQKLYITEAQINSWAVIITILFLCLYLTHGITAKVKTRRQLIAEWIVEQTEKMVRESMGEVFSGFAAFICSIMALSAFSSLMSLFGLFPPTSDLNITAGWALLVFILITYYKLKCGPINYLGTFAEPTPVLTPINIISEVATPVSMAFRHYGNVLSGVVVSVLLAAALQGLSGLLLGWLPGVLGEIPFLQIGIPAVLSIYFDVFSGCLQAYIFAVLTMMYVGGAFNIDEYERRKLRKQQKKQMANQ